jgi:Complex I intermediate-associated protein 30 (CIA30)
VGKGWFVMAAVLAGSRLWAAADPYQGWTKEQLKAEIVRLKELVAELRFKTAPDSGYGAGHSEAVTGTAVPVDDFESDMPAMGGSWWEGCDQNDMGTTLIPNPFERLAGGSPLSPGFCAGMKGHLGPNEEPWTWASLTLSLEKDGTPADLTPYRALRFYVKGDGKEHVVQLQKESVKDYADFQAVFVSPFAWTQVTLPFDQFSQPDWGARLERKFDDVKALSFQPGLHDADFDFRIDDVEWIK